MFAAKTPGCLFCKKFTVTHNSCNIFIKEFGISLAIPEAALKYGEAKEIYIGVSWRTEDFPELPDGHTRTSPVVVCGPHGTTFQKPILLAFPHCIPDPYISTQSKIWKSETSAVQ